MSESTGHSPPTIARVFAGDAAVRRHIADTTASTSDAAQLMHEHEKRQLFRRLIDPGIFRPNSREVAMNALKTLSMIAENMLREPENPKYRSFKRENDTIKRRLIEPKGALEYALELGFRPKVVDFQSHYVFGPSHTEDLRIGAAMLKEALDRETAKEEREVRNREEQKAAAAAVARNVKLAFLDDRKNKMMHDEMERARREAREAAAATGAGAGAGLGESSPERNPIPMPGGPGHTLSLSGADDVDALELDQPPPYNG